MTRRRSFEQEVSLPYPAHSVWRLIHTSWRAVGSAVPAGGEIGWRDETAPRVLRMLDNLGGPPTVGYLQLLDVDHDSRTASLSFHGAATGSAEHHTATAQVRVREADASTCILTVFADDDATQRIGLAATVVATLSTLARTAEDASAHQAGRQDEAPTALGRRRICAPGGRITAITAATAGGVAIAAVIALIIRRMRRPSPGSRRR